MRVGGMNHEMNDMRSWVWSQPEHNIILASHRSNLFVCHSSDCPPPSPSVLPSLEPVTSLVRRRGTIFGGITQKDVSPLSLGSLLLFSHKGSVIKVSCFFTTPKRGNKNSGFVRKS